MSHAASPQAKGLGKLGGDSRAEQEDADAKSKKEKEVGPALEAGMFLRTSLTSAVRQPAHFTCFLTLTYELLAC